MKTFAALSFGAIAIFSFVFFGSMTFLSQDTNGSASAVGISSVKGTAGNVDDLSVSLNSQILAIKDLYPSDGSVKMMPGARQNKALGTTTDIYYKNKLAIRKDAEGQTHCIGLVFEVYWRALGEAWLVYKPGTFVDLPGSEDREFNSFRKEFYGTDGNIMTLVNAVSSRGMGILIQETSLAKSGDLVQFWRHDGSGHAVIFLSWLGDSSQPEGIKYWSVQRKTGISINEERIGLGADSIIRDQIYIVRPLKPSAWEVR